MQWCCDGSAFALQTSWCSSYIQVLKGTSEFRLLKLTSFLMCLQRIKLHLNPGPASSTDIFHLMLFMRSVS